MKCLSAILLKFPTGCETQPLKLELRKEEEKNMGSYSRVLQYGSFPAKAFLVLTGRIAVISY
jgi:hypothetical protein